MNVADEDKVISLWIAQLDKRYDDYKSGRVKPIDGEDFFENLCQLEKQLLGQISSDPENQR